MQVKINEKIFSVPPYLSTSWSRIAALHLKGSVLVASLIDGDTINIPNLPQETISLIFTHHAAYLEKEQPDLHFPVEANDMMKQMMNPEASSLSFSINSLDGLGSPMQHNPEQANAPDLPVEVLEKIAAVARIFNPEETKLLPPPEPACNCFHCQILKTLNPVMSAPQLQVEDHHEVIKDEELQFQQWAIKQVADQLFSVTNKLDQSEKYNVFLGNPVGCTCGNDNCEHILAVLKS
jgi:hypothetical protein